MRFGRKTAYFSFCVQMFLVLNASRRIIYRVSIKKPVSGKMAVTPLWRVLGEKVGDF